jgi:hypothetical protein
MAVSMMNPGDAWSPMNPLLAERPKRGTQFGGKEPGLLPRREMSALIDLVK